MGLAIATDYALFIVSRYRDERAAGRVKLDAIAASGGTASRAVVFSGLAFVLAMCGLLLVPDSVLRSLGVGAITVGLVSVLGALTLIPALLSLLGDRVNALRVPVPRPRGRLRRPGGPVLVGNRPGRDATSGGQPRRRQSPSCCSAAAFVRRPASSRTRASGRFPTVCPPRRASSRWSRSSASAPTDSVQVAVEGDVAVPPARGAVRELARRLESNRLLPQRRGRGQPGPEARAR